MKKILIHHFHCLNNYGSAMMGLITLNELNKNLKGDVEFYFPSNNYSTIEEIKRELGDSINLNIHKIPKIKWSKIKLGRSIQKRKYLVDASEIKDYDAVIILGGDDLSEYYTKKIYRELLKYWRWSKSKKIFLLGQSIGPFQEKKNRFVIKYFYKKIPIFVRDAWSKTYLKNEFGLKKNIFQSADIAFLDLPLQNHKNIEIQTLKKYNLITNQYITIVISGLVGKYYTDDKQKYFEAFKNIINNLKSDKRFENYKIVLLAHTYPPHGNEAEIINEFTAILSENEKQNIIPITDKIFPTRARFILGNGKFTITGRMHAALSTFQMEKPAIALSYSAKYKGVIGTNLNRNDLIIEADDKNLWNNGKIVNLVMDKVNYLNENYDKITEQIKQKVKEQKELVYNSFKIITKEINK